MNFPDFSDMAGRASSTPSFMASFEALVIDMLWSKDREYIVLAGLNCDGKIIHWFERAGVIVESLINQEDILTILSDPEVVSIALAHNHPSGDSRPSRADVVTTHRLLDFCAKSGVKIVEHMVVGSVSADQILQTHQ